MSTYSRLSQCDGKIPYSDQRAASLARQEMKRDKRRAVVGTLRIYFCGWCAAWHLGHKPPRRAQRYPTPASVNTTITESP